MLLKEVLSRTNTARFLFCFLLLLKPSMSIGQTPDPITSVEGITEYQLENGLKVLLFPDDSKPTVTVNLTLFVGSRHEGYGEAGMAHLLEHMLFKGTPSHPNIPKSLQDLGAQFNGTTWVDRTNYYETLPASEENLEFALQLEADRMVNSLIRGEDLESEMTVVRSDFESGESSPLRILLQRMQAAAYEWHNYGKSTIGNRSDIERVPITNLRAFYRKHYQPDNAMLIVAGKFDRARALELILKHFGPLERRPPARRRRQPCGCGLPHPRQLSPGLPSDSRPPKLNDQRARRQALQGFGGIKKSGHRAGNGVCFS